MLEWNNSWNSQLSSVLKRAVINGIPTDERKALKNKLQFIMVWINERYQGKCPCCKERDLIKTPKKVTDNTPSIHKIAPKEGYVTQNVMIVCTWCNIQISNGGYNDIRNLHLKIKTLNLELEMLKL